MKASRTNDSERRAELLELAARMFAERGFRATTVRDIADAAGILSGSLYHHFDSKESMVDEILTGFLDELFGRYREIVAAGLPPLTAAVTSANLTSHRVGPRQRAAVARRANAVTHAGCSRTRPRR